MAISIVLTRCLSRMNASIIVPRLECEEAAAICLARFALPLRDLIKFQFKLADAQRRVVLYKSSPVQPD